MEIRYLECPSCKLCFSEKKLKLHGFNDPCPYCKKITGICKRWPSLGIYKFLEIAKNQKLNEKITNELVICIVFLCTALEALLEVILYELIETKKSKINLKEIMDLGRIEKIKKYKELNNKCSLKKF